MIKDIRQNKSDQQGVPPWDTMPAEYEKGKKTIDEVPAVIRPQVIQILKDLDVDIPNK